MGVRDARTPADGFSPWLVAGSLWSAPQHHAAEGMQMSVGTVSPSLSKYRRVHIYGRTRAKHGAKHGAKIGIHILERGLSLGSFRLKNQSLYRLENTAV